MCYSHVGNEVRNGKISIMQRGFINAHYIGKPRWPMGVCNGNGVYRSLGAMLHYRTTV